MAMADGSDLAADLRKRVEIMADHIARNGADFEATVKQKNANNPQFAFLYNGEGSVYYQQVLARHRGVQAAKAPPQANPPAAASLATLLRSGQVNPPPQPSPVLPKPPQPTVVQPSLVQPRPAQMSPGHQSPYQQNLGVSQMNQGQIGSLTNLLRQEVRPSGFQAPMRIGVPPGLQTPETVPVGILSNMLASARDLPRQVRYKPLDPVSTPQTLPMEVPSAHLLGRVEEFYDELRDEERASSSSSSSRSRSRERDGRDYPGHFYSTRNGAKSIVMDLFWQGKQEWE
ncbi:unnamed protein product [Durusdinium trenchii]|uniref:SURP motif domain-containing protein n=1 Tax=Durusdinium trenchii TaxID=1381693 RepID=A0ABP0R9X5_9DINO